MVLLISLRLQEITAPTIHRARKMMRILAELPPQTPKMKTLYAELETERQHGLKILYALERARLLRLLPSEHDSNDGVEFTRGNKIPRWLFGFLY